MDEAQFLADRVAVIAGGHIVAEGTPASIGGRDRAITRVSFRLPPGVTLPDQIGAVAGTDGHWELVADELTATLYRLTGWAVQQGVELEELSVVRPSLEDVYLQLTGAPSGPAAAGPPESRGGRRRHRAARSPGTP
jgi:ABC-2 type transport system ATP-binding protein